MLESKEESTGGIVIESSVGTNFPKKRKHECDNGDETSSRACAQCKILESKLYDMEIRERSHRLALFWHDHGIEDIKRAFAHRNMTTSRCGCTSCLYSQRNRHGGRDSVMGYEVPAGGMCRWQPAVEAKMNELGITFGDAVEVLDSPKRTLAQHLKRELVPHVMLANTMLPIPILDMVMEYAVRVDKRLFRQEHALADFDVHFFGSRGDWCHFEFGRKLWSATDPDTDPEIAKLVVLLAWLRSAPGDWPCLCP